MGHKVHPLGFRIGVIYGWQAKWYADKHYSELLQEDLKLRQAIRSKYAGAGVSRVDTDRQANRVSVTIYTARPGVAIGRGGQRADEMRLYLEELIGKKVQLNIQEIQQPQLDAYLVARTVAEQIERRIAFRRAMKQAVFRTMQAGAKGVKISCAGRLGGAEIARRQTIHQGQVPLHTLRADIDYGFTEVHTTLGRIGVKVWIYEGDILPEPKEVEVEEAPVEVVSEVVEAGPVGVAAEPEAKPEEMEVEEMPTEVVSEVVEAELPTAAEPIEKPGEPVTAESAEVAPELRPEEKPAKPRVRRVRKAVAVEPEEGAVRPEAGITTEATPELKPEEKPAKPRARRVKKAAGVKPEESAVRPEAEITTEAAPTTIEKEEKDATTQAGEIPQESQGTPQG